MYKNPVNRVTKKRIKFTYKPGKKIGLWIDAKE